MGINYREYLRSDEWNLVAHQAKKRAGFRCQLCNHAGSLHAHHRTYERLGDEADADVIALCPECHAKFHGADIAHWLDAVRSELPLVWALCLAQAKQLVHSGSDSVMVLFGSDAARQIVARWNGLVVCGRKLVCAMLTEPHGALVVSTDYARQEEDGYGH